MDIEIHVSPKMSFMMLNKKSVKKYENLELVWKHDNEL